MQVRKEKGLSREELAKKIGTSVMKVTTGCLLLK
ncbi:helix-turn-helix domain-containing protein [Neptunitalea chrysea]